MAELIHDRGRGPEIVGTRITVYNLLPHFLDPTTTEAYICKLYGLSPEQVAAVRGYILNNPETVLARHLEIEARIAVGNPPEVIERAKQTHATLLRFKEWLVQRRQAEAEESAGEPAPGSDPSDPKPFPSFREWVMQQESRPGQGL